MALLQFERGSKTTDAAFQPGVETFLQDYSIEVTPRTARKVGSFRELLPEGTRVYIAHIAGVAIEDMVATAKRLASEGYRAVPHFPARIIKDRRSLADWIARYQGEAGVEHALLLAGGIDRPYGEFHNSMQLMETGLFDKAGFKRLHVAGHPEGNKDIDPDGSEKNVMEALHWKQAFSMRTDAQMALVTQFCFEAATVIAWTDGLKASGIDLPVHVGVAGPANLQTLIKFSIACGVGTSLRVLQRRARDVTKLLLPFKPDQFIADLAAFKAAHPQSSIARVHFFPLGGIKASANWAIEHGGVATRPANQV
ncbi:MAG: methylenetetrahydrofolate reductase [Pseudomonadota bacterium]